MTREVLALPEPARTLLRTAFETVDNALLAIVPQGHRWRLGGGTLLAARWAHRRSTDIDIFLPGNSGITTLDPRWNPQFAHAMSAVGANRIEVQTNSLKFSFPTGRIEITQLDPTPNLPPEIAVVDGREIAVTGNGQILTGKLPGRGARLPARDVFDVAVARHEDPSALRTAVNFLDPALRTEIIHVIRIGSNLYVDAAPHAIIEPAQRWAHLIRQGPDEAIEAIERSTYRTIDIRYAGNTACIALTAEDGWYAEETFATGSELSEGLTRLGVERIMRRDHLSVDDFIRAADARLASAAGDEHSGRD